MKREDIITGEEIEINVRRNASPYEIRQEIIRESAQNWLKRAENGKIDKVTQLKNIKMFEKMAERHGLQKELREMGVI